MKPLNCFSFYLTVFLLALLSTSLSTVNKSPENSWFNNNIRINPDFKISRASNGTVTIASKGTEKKVSYQMTGFNADLIMALYRNSDIDKTTSSLGEKYYLSESDCRREIKKTIRELSDWKIIIID